MELKISRINILRALWYNKEFIWSLIPAKSFKFPRNFLSDRNVFVMLMRWLTVGRSEYFQQ